jgi:molybdopterin-containing oxidoreductase family iron-sulfur binding subunit
MNRRVFLKVIGAATAAAAGCKPTQVPEKLIPYLVPPEQIPPGQPTLFRTLCRECTSGCGVTAAVRDGRVVKLEGNPEDPISRGALCARGQAALQGLYAPDRFRRPRLFGKAVAWDAAVAQAADWLRGAPADSIRLVTRSEPTSVGALQRAFLEAIGGGAEQRIVLEPMDITALRQAGTTLYDRAELPVWDLAAARTVVSFGADFVESWQSPVELARQFANAKAGLVWVGPRLALSGARAESWLAVRAGGELAVALGLLRWLCDPQNGVANLTDAPAVFDRVRALEPAQLERRAGVAWAKIVELGRTLAAKRPSALLGPGIAGAGADAAELAVAIQLCNHVLGNVGRTLRYGVDANLDPPSDAEEVQTLAGDIAAGKVKVLLVHHADLAGALPAAFGFALAKVPAIISFGDRPDATTARAHLVLPDHHPLESWGDMQTRHGTVALAQPVMQPIGDTRSAGQTLLDIAGKLPNPAVHFPFKDFHQYLRTRAETWAMLSLGASGDLESVHRTALQLGGYYGSAPDAVPVTLRELPKLALAEAEVPGLSLVTFPTALRRAEGLTAPWLREIPDVLSGVSWTSWAELSPAAAQKLAVDDGDLVEVKTAAGRAEVPVCVRPFLRDDVIAMPLGGDEARAILPVDRWSAVPASVARTGRRTELARSDAGPRMGPGEVFERHETPAHGMAPEPKHPVHRWAMAIDLDRCNGCQACVVACYAENNIPVVGPEMMAKSRHMAWLTIQRYAGEGGFEFLPMLCQHCSSGPCETVCPVYATYHTPEGLNAQVYNRCVGTRYCANNCPYKVRVFNWWDASFEKPLDWQLNPDVSVRSKGVMEKCSFCVQRIRRAEIAAKGEQRALHDGDVTPACAQTCPAQAIVFGDANDPQSRVAALAEDRRAFHVLADLNTRPAVAYLRSKP